MKKRKSRGSKSNLRYISPRKIALLGAILIVIYFLIAVIVISRQFRPTVETSRSEVSKIPRDIKKSLKKQALTATSSAQLRVPILMYHYVEYVKDQKDQMRKSLNIIPSIFELQIINLKNAGYDFMTARELGEVIDGKRTLPKKPILLTFDDGHWDLDTVVLPLLKKYNIKATAYVIPGFIDDSDFMTKKQLREVVDSGMVDVGAHTVHHVSLSEKLFPVVNYEVVESKRMLERDYNIQVVSFAYPNGAFDEQAVDVVRKAGFTTGVSTVPGVEQSNQNRFFLYRLRPGYRTGDELLNYLQGDNFRAY